MKINPPADDSGVESLKRTNVTKPVAQTPAVATTPRIAPLEEHHPPPLPPVSERRKTERRSGERRQKQQPVLLDTRAPHERRLHERRDPASDQVSAAPPSEGESSSATGIDETV